MWGLTRHSKASKKLFRKKVAVAKYNFEFCVEIVVSLMIMLKF